MEWTESKGYSKRRTGLSQNRDVPNERDVHKNENDCVKHGRFSQKRERLSQNTGRLMILFRSCSHLTTILQGKTSTDLSLCQAVLILHKLQFLNITNINLFFFLKSLNTYTSAKTQLILTLK